MFNPVYNTFSGGFSRWSDKTPSWKCRDVEYTFLYGICRLCKSIDDLKEGGTCVHWSFHINTFGHMKNGFSRDFHMIIKKTCPFIVFGFDHINELIDWHDE